ncbi:hypothetical protein [Weissella confusa]|nr:hypothetical protein [Weissella confusa]
MNKTFKEWNKAVSETTEEIKQVTEDIKIAMLVVNEQHQHRVRTK